MERSNVLEEIENNLMYGDAGSEQFIQICEKCFCANDIGKIMRPGETIYKKQIAGGW